VAVVAGVLAMVPLTAVILLATSPVVATDDLTVVVRYSTPGEVAPREKILPLDRGRILVVDDLEYGDSIEGHHVLFREPTWDASPCRVQMQYETSVTIANAGSRLDLLDWIHFTSFWADTKRIKENEFRIPELSHAERTRFPDVPGWELREAVENRGGPEWADRVKDVESAYDAPASVTLSAVRLRVVCGTESTAGAFGTLEFRIPMGR
jgi:hypothetical protein